MVSNEFSLPYLTKTEPITAITMARIIGELLPDLSVPYGVNVLWDGRASIDLAVATGAKFVREIFTGVYASDFGLWDTNVGEVARHRARVGGADVKLFFNIVPESATYLADRDLASITRTTVFATLPDAICVSGRDRRIADGCRGAARGEVGGRGGAGVRQHRACAPRTSPPNSRSPTAPSSARTSRRTASSRTGRNGTRVEELMGAARRSANNWPERRSRAGHNRDMATWKDVARIVTELPGDQRAVASKLAGAQEADRLGTAAAQGGLRGARCRRPDGGGHEPGTPSSNRRHRSGRRWPKPSEDGQVPRTLPG